MADNEKALLVLCSARPTDDEIRALHEWSRNIGDIEQLYAAVDRLDNNVMMLTTGTALSDGLHIKALRDILPSVAKDLRAALRWRSP
jgi:hypothetical protein